MKTSLRAIGRKIPGLSSAYWALRSVRFPGTQAYWNRRYARGGTSGPGSYGRLAHFKAETLNALVVRHDVRSLIEFGCGDGHQLSLARYPAYTGLDVSPAALQRCIEQFGSDPTKSFFLYNRHAFHDPRAQLSADAALSLDVIYHLSEDEVFESYMRHLFQAAKRFVIIYSSNFDERTPAAYLRHREFTAWIRANTSDWTLTERVPNPYAWDPNDPDNTSFADFYVFQRP
jgi:hypothetical protein